MHTMLHEILESDMHGVLREIGVLALGALREFGVRNDLSEREFWKGRHFVEDVVAHGGGSLLV